MNLSEIHLQFLNYFPCRLHPLPPITTITIIITLALTVLQGPLRIFFPLLEQFEEYEETE